jgi:hypothetical protein
MEQVFLMEEGYHVDENILFQDNRSTIMLEKNDRILSIMRTKHINVRYYFVTDRIAKRELKVQWCPTDEMIAVYMTKPLQGKPFKRFRDLIMGLASPAGRIVGLYDKTCLVLLLVGMFTNKS